MTKVLTTCVLFVLTGCSDASCAKQTAKGKPHKVELFSGGTIVRSWTSTGRPESETNSDGYYFKDKATGVLLEVSGTVVLTPLTGGKSADND